MIQTSIAGTLSPAISVAECCTGSADLGRSSDNQRFSVSESGIDAG